MIEAILPAGVASAESFGDPPDAVLFDAEAESIVRAVAKRRNEYTTARHCARLAMSELGVAPVAILTGNNREPLWPPGIVGSMTHCDGYRAAALARNDLVASLGIDAEPHAPLPAGVLTTIARPEELVRLAELADAFPDVWWDRLTFSAKESVYKAWFPLARRWLGFEDATLLIDPAAGTFTAELLQADLPVVGGRAFDTVSGRWLVRDGFVVTSAAVGPDGLGMPRA